jgi:glycolate oxidase
LHPDILQFLKETVGEKNVRTQIIDRISYASDASEFKHLPDAAACPTTTQQVAAIMEMAFRENIPITPRGAGTSVSGLTVPVKGGIVLDLIQMNKILKISPEDRLAVVQPGVVYGDLDRALKPLGFSFPPEPASGKVATLGGNVATNAGGVKGAKYGTTRNYVLGLEVVLADGQVLRTGSHTLKCVSGLDLTRLFVGSEGVLGVITEIILRIDPRPLETSTAMATFENLSDAGRAVAAIMKSGAVPSVLEVVDRNCIRAINQNTNMELPEVAAILLAETDGSTKTETEAQMDKITRVFKENNASSVRLAQTAAEAEALWAARKSAYPVIARLNNTVISEDTTVPISKVVDMLEVIAELAVKYDILLVTVGHVADGNLHPHFTYDSTDPDVSRRVTEARAELYRRAIELGGTLTGEHGIGLGKAAFMSLEHSEVAMGVMRKIKQALDPKNILNPGKMDLDVCQE